MTKKIKLKLSLAIILLLLFNTGCAASKQTGGNNTTSSTAQGVSSTVENGTKPAETTATSAETTSETSAKDNTFIFPDSDTRKLDEGEIKGIKSELLPFARNEIFARRGYIFTKDEYKNYFAQKAWYNPDPNFNTNSFTEIEKHNIDFIKSYEAPTSSNQQNTSTSLKTFYKANVTVSVDLNGDGVNEKIVYKPDSGRLLINNKSAAFEFDSPENSFAIADIDVNDKFKEVLLCDAGPSDDYETHYYYFDGTNIIKMGKTEGSFEYGVGVNGSGKITASTRLMFLQTWFTNKSFKLSSAHKLVEVPQDIYVTDSAVTLKVQLKLYKNRGDSTPSITVNKGQKGNIIRTDGKSWCLIKMSNGTKGWFTTDKYDNIANTGLPADQVFDGLCFAD